VSSDEETSILREADHEGLAQLLAEISKHNPGIDIESLVFEYRDGKVRIVGKHLKPADSNDVDNPILPTSF